VSPADWATCPLLVYLHVATDCVVRRLGTPVGKDVTGCVGSKTPEGQSTYRPLIPEDTRRQIVNFGESTLGESAGGKFETFEARRAEEIHNH
jgi:hypothetical protein